MIDSKKVRTAVVLMNLGGPRNSEEVYPFLNRLFSDPDLIPIPFQQTLAPWIARRRTPKIQKQYSEIGGGSPIGSWTRQQADLMVTRLNQISPATAPHKAYIAFRYASPLTEIAIQEMIDDGVDRAVAFTQYPQYSCSTTGSSLNELARKLELIQPRISWSLIDRWPTHRLLIQAFSNLIRDKLNKYDSTVRDDVILLFTAHSLPMSVVNRGDPYPAEVAATVYDIMKELRFSNRYRLVWQSQVGPAPWLGPRTDKAIEGLAKAGHKNIMLIPVAFTSDHVETLFELDKEYGELAEKVGVTGLTRCDSLNVDPTFIEALAQIVKTHLDTGEKHSKQFLLRCPGCDKQSCKNSREYFLKH